MYINKKLYKTMISVNCLNKNNFWFLLSNLNKNKNLTFRTKKTLKNLNIVSHKLINKNLVKLIKISINCQLNFITCSLFLVKLNKKLVIKFIKLKFKSNIHLPWKIGKYSSLDGTLLADSAGGTLPYQVSSRYTYQSA